MNTRYIAQLAEDALTNAASGVLVVVTADAANMLEWHWQLVGGAAVTGAFLSIVKSLAAPGRQTFFTSAARKPGKYERI